MSTGYAWMNSSLTADQYCEYWIREIPSTGEVTRDRWDEYWATLVAAQIVEEGERPKFDAEFTRTRRNRAQPRPGLFCEFQWPLDDARRLDSQETLVGTVRQRVNQLLSALGAPLIEI